MISQKISRLSFSKVSVTGLKTCASVILDSQVQQFAKGKDKCIREGKTCFHSKQMHN